MHLASSKESSSGLVLHADAEIGRPICVVSTYAAGERLALRHGDKVTPATYEGDPKDFDADPFKEYHFDFVSDNNDEARAFAVVLMGRCMTAKCSGVRVIHTIDMPKGWQFEDIALDLLDYEAWCARDDHTRFNYLTVRASSKSLNAEATNGDSYEVRQKWRDLGLSEINGKVQPNIDNALRALTASEIPIWYDEFLQRGMTSWNCAPRELRDSDIVDLTIWMQRDLHLPTMSRRNVEAAIESFQRANTRNCAQTWLKSLTWDHTPRLPLLCSEGFGTDDTAYYQAVGRCFIMSIVKRVLQPGCQVDTVPVFEGSQGAFKSTALRLLGGQWFAECHEDIMGKGFLEIMPGKMLLEIAELHSFRRADVMRIKGVISNTSDRYRNTYGRLAGDHPRMCVFAATTNQDDWHRDDTGGRRWWPVRCGTINLAWIRDNRAQLFAEAVVRVLAGESHWNVPAEDASAMVAARMATDPWQAPIEQYLFGKTETSPDDILDGCLHIDIGKREKIMSDRVRSVLRIIGWESKTTTRNKRTVRLWTPQNAYKKSVIDAINVPAPAPEAPPAPLDEPEDWLSGDDIPF